LDFLARITPLFPNGNGDFSASFNPGLYGGWIAFCQVALFAAPYESLIRWAD
jgi:hypothetical protein